MTKTLQVSDETYEKIKSQLQEEEQKDISQLQDFVGEKLFIRTVTYHLTGKVEKIFGNMMELSNGAWIADSGRFEQAIKDGTLNEVEPVGKVFINLNSVVDMFPWTHKLPQSQK